MILYGLIAAFVRLIRLDAGGAEEMTSSIMSNGIDFWRTIAVVSFILVPGELMRTPCAVIRWFRYTWESQHDISHSIVGSTNFQKPYLPQRSTSLSRDQSIIGVVNHGLQQQSGETPNTVDAAGSVSG